MPHDTPVDTPAVTGIERSAPPPLARRAETLEAAYTAWAELEAERSALVKTFAAEAEQLEQQGSLFLGAVNAVGPSQASSDQPAALVRQSNLEQLATAARKRLEASKVDLDQRVQREQQRLTEAIAVTVAEVRARVARRLAHARPSIELMVRVLQGDRRILHVRRLTPDDAVTLVFASSGRIPSRYGFLFDDSTDDATLPPPTLYGEPGIASTDLRARPAVLEKILKSRPEVWPIKAMIPLWVQAGDGSHTICRWLERGAVMEAEVADGETFRNLLTREEAERVTGALLALKLDGKLDLELVRG